MTDASEQTVALAEDIAALVKSEFIQGRQLIILPEFIEEIDGALVASFIDSTQELRVELSDRGVDVQLAIPDGAEPRPYEQHFVEWVLPVILAVPGAITSTAQIVAWLRDWHAQQGDKVIRYREARLEEVDQRYVVRELVGPANQVADTLERLNLGQPQIGKPDGQ